MTKETKKGHSLKVPKMGHYVNKSKKRPLPKRGLKYYMTFSKLFSFITNFSKIHLFYICIKKLTYITLGVYVCDCAYASACTHCAQRSCTNYLLNDSTGERRKGESYVVDTYIFSKQTTNSWSN